MPINGREIAKKILNELSIKVQKLKEKGLPAGRQGITPTLAIILVGDNPQSVAYIEQKELKATKIGAKVIIKKLPLNSSQSTILKTIEQFNKNNNVHGIIVQRPVEGISSDVLDSAVMPKKDVDGFHPNSKFEPPIAQAVFRIIKSVEPNFAGKKIVVIGKGETGGGPVIKALKRTGIEPMVIDSKTHNPSPITQNCDIVISAVGKQGVVHPNELKKGVILVSIGLSLGNDGKMHGDYNEKEIENVASFYTPTPGGVGPVNVTMLLKNLVEAAS